MPQARKLLFPYCYSTYRQEFFGRHRGWLADQKIDQTIKGTVTVKQAGMERDFAVEQKGTFEVKMTPGS